MREDMVKVLVERPRRGGHGARMGRPLREGQPLPARQGLRRAVKERGDFKSLNENLAPLRRYLERQVGRPWNKVHGEMRARVKPGNTVQEHLLTHVDDFVHQGVRRVPPSPETPCGLAYAFHHGGLGWRGRGLSASDLYIDPADGLLKRARRKLKGPRG